VTVSARSSPAEFRTAQRGKGMRSLRKETLPRTSAGEARVAGAHRGSLVKVDERQANA
jgi:hypothetical protein